MNYNNYYPYNGYQQSMINGKVVDSVEVAKAMEVPLGGYGVFPKADLSEVYIKTWNGNGTTSVTIFRPIVEEKKESIEDQLNHLREELAEVRAMIPSQPVIPEKEVKHEF